MAEPPAEGVTVIRFVGGPCDGDIGEVPAKMDEYRVLRHSESRGVYGEYLLAQVEGSGQLVMLWTGEVYTFEEVKDIARRFDRDEVVIRSDSRKYGQG